jgi:hypothetical protein
MSSEECVLNHFAPAIYLCGDLFFLCSDTRISETADAPMHEPPTPTEPPTGPATGTKKRPRLDLNVDPRERKRGKSMFGLLLGTLNKAKIEDKERNASEAVRSLISIYRNRVFFLT